MDRVQFSEIARQVYLLRQPVLDVNATVVVGEEVAAVIDTLSTDAQAAELLDAIRTVTPLPLVLINTHHHFDHCFGNHYLAGHGPAAGVWAHEAAAATLRDHWARLQRELYTLYLPTEPELAQGLAEVPAHPPDQIVTAAATLDLGGRSLELKHLGRGHTDGDLLVWVSDAPVLVAGDLVEAAGVAFEDAYPIEWPRTLAAALRATASGTAVVPGHGAVTDLDLVRAQHDELARLAWLIRDGHGDGAPINAVAVRARADQPTLSEDTARTAVRRGYDELSGRI